MPVVLEQLDNPSEQDLIDLEKLYNDYPTDFRFHNLQTLLSENPNLKLYGARFNARLLGAITLEKQGVQLKLDHLCVRAVTRQRNVAKDLLRLLPHCENTSCFVFDSCIDDPAINALFSSAGFTKDNQSYTRFL